MLVILASPVMLFIHQMVSGTESHESGVVRRRWDGDGAGAAHVCVAQLVGEDLQLVSRKAIVVPQDVVVWGPAGALRRGPQNVTPQAHGHEWMFAPSLWAHLDSCMTAQVEIKLERMRDACVDRSSCGNVPTLPDLSKNTRIRIKIA